MCPRLVSAINPYIPLSLIRISLSLSLMLGSTFFASAVVNQLHQLHHLPQGFRVIHQRHRRPGMAMLGSAMR